MCELESCTAQEADSALTPSRMALRLREARAAAAGTAAGGRRLRAAAAAAEARAMAAEAGERRANAAAAAADARAHRGAERARRAQAQLGHMQLRMVSRAHKPPHILVAPGDAHLLQFTDTAEHIASSLHM